MTIAETKVKSIYISAGCNKVPKSLDWGGSENQIIFAQSNAIALLASAAAARGGKQQQQQQITATFNKHTDRVNSVKWISTSFIGNDQLSLNEFISASKDKTIVIWQGTNNQVIVCVFTCTFSWLSLF